MVAVTQHEKLHQFKKIPVYMSVILLFALLQYDCSTSLTVYKIAVVVIYFSFGEEESVVYLSLYRFL